MNKDKIYSQPLSKVTPFTFNKEVAEVFDDMVNRSIPFYKELQELIAQLALAYVQPESSIYDLGCSTGETMLQISRKSSTPLSIIGLDSSEQMITKAKKKCQKYPHLLFNKADITDFEFQPSSVFILTYVMQFIAPEKRLSFLKTIYSHLLPKGVLIISEKIKFPNINEDIVGFYEQFKAKNYYSELEIKQKREALENVLISYTLPENIELLKQAGFSIVQPVFQYLNFCCLLAIKND